MHPSDNMVVDFHANVAQGFHRILTHPHSPIAPRHVVAWRDLKWASIELADITFDKLRCISRADLAQ